MRQIGTAGALFLLLYWLFKDVRFKQEHDCGRTEVR